MKLFYSILDLFRSKKALFKAVDEENLEKLERKLRDGYNPDVTISSSKETPIFDVVNSYGDKIIDMLRLFIRYGADLNHRDSEGESVIFHTDSKKVAEILYHSGADLSVRSNSGHSVLHYVSYKSLAEFYIKQGLDVNEPDKFGETPLFNAVLGGKDKTQLFLENGADPNLKNNNGITPLSWLVMQEEMEEEEYFEAFDVCDLLLSNGAKIDETDKEGKTAIDYASEFGNPKLAKYLKDKLKEQTDKT